MEELSDNYLMKKVQGGDLSKMGLLYERYNRDLFAYFFRCCGVRDISEDMVHNVFVRLIRYRHTFGGHGQFSYWLFAMARNVWLDEVRSKNVLKESDELAEINDSESKVKDPEQVYHQEERKNILTQALQKLSDEKREAIILSRFQGMKYKEIAEIANCSENAIKSRVQRGLIELREIVLKLESI